MVGKNVLVRHRRRFPILIQQWDFGVCGILLFFIGVTENADVTIIGRPEKPMVEVAKELHGKLFILRSVGEGIFLLKRKIHHQDPLRELAMLIH
jgi:hypothetical protein